MDTNVSTSSSAAVTGRRRPRIVIIEEHTAVADVLDVGLWGRYRVRSVIVSQQSSVASTISAARASRPDVAIVASRSGPLVDTEAVMSGLRQAAVPVIALSTMGVDDDPEHWGRCLLAGAVGVLPKTADLDELRRMLELVLTGQPPMCPALATRLRDAADAVAGDECWTARERLSSLSRREREVISRLMSGRSPIEIAREDVVAEATVRTQVKSILAKLEVNTQIGAVAAARRAGWSATDLPIAG